jgi:hypothetical protein
MPRKFNDTLALLLLALIVGVWIVARRLEMPSEVIGATVETSEYQNDFKLTVDLSGTAITTASVVAVVMLLWYGFTSAPTLAAL